VCVCCVYVYKVSGLTDVPWSFDILCLTHLQNGCRLIGIGANFALFYLAAVFIYRMFIPGSAAQLSEDNVGTGCCTTEADIARWIRIFLPAINLVLTKTRQVFSGDPATTLKVAAVLWLLARAGSRMSLWSFVRLCVFEIFPPFYISLSVLERNFHFHSWVSTLNLKSTFFVTYFGRLFWSLHCSKML
jgi:hypothetical protein